VRSQDMVTGVLRVDQAAHVSIETYNERIRRAKPSFGDLLYSREGTYFGIAAEVPEDAPLCLGQRMVLIRPDADLINSRYLRFWLNSRVLALHIHGHRDGTVAERLNLPTIRGLPVPVPSMEEQNSIARILGTLDDKIELNRRMNETLEAMARAIFKSWFVDFDPVRAKAEGRQPEGIDAETAALFPDGFDDSDLGEIPRGWNIGNLGDQFDITMGQSPPGDTYNEIGNGLPFFQGRRDFGFRYPLNRVYCTEPKRYAKKDDTLVSVRAPVGDINLAKEDCCIGRGIAAVCHKSNSCSYTYEAMYTLKSHFGNFENEGTVFGSINKNDFHGLQFITPEEKIISAFDGLSEPTYSQIENLSDESQTLITLRNSLLPKLLSGEIRVKDAEKLAEEVA